VKVTQEMLEKLIREEIEESIFDILKKKDKSIATPAIGKDIASHKKLGLDVEEMNLDKAFEKIADLEAKIDALLSQHDED